MISLAVRSLNEIIEEVRQGEIDQLEISVTASGKTNKITVSNGDKKAGRMKKIKIDNPDLSHADLSKLDVMGDMSDLDLHEVDFTDSRIRKSDVSRSNLREAKLTRTRISQTLMANAYITDMSDAYITGSVDLYAVNRPQVWESYDVKGVYDTGDDNMQTFAYVNDSYTPPTSNKRKGGY